MTHIKCLNGPEKGFETNIDQTLTMGDLVSIPVEVGDHQEYVHYKAAGYINDKWLLCHANPELAKAANDDPRGT